MMTVASTLIWGESSVRDAPKMRSGNVSTEPELKNVTMKSSMDRAKLSSPAARIPGVISGSVTRLNVRHGDAPRSMAASSSVQSKPRIRALMVRATNEVQKRMWAMRIVPKPRATPRLMNSVASDEPITTSGVVMGRMSSNPISTPPRKR